MRIGEQYGFTAKEANNLEALWYRKIIGDCTWGNLEEFVAWVATVEYGKRMFVQKRRTREPHGPDNTYFTRKKDDETNAFQLEKGERFGYCKNCTNESCYRQGRGCKPWRIWYISNWNRNISTNPAAKIPVPEPTYWTYEHPDRVREMMGNG